MTTKPAREQKSPERPECFVIMPISEPDGYSPDHFMRVYKDIITPACDKAGFKAIRADDVFESNLIQKDILDRLVLAPMAICDLSTRNPNVLFELALRQAFEKPVALIQEFGTPQIFDIAYFRITSYNKDRIYHQVLDDQEKISQCITDTFNAHSNGKGIMSIVKLLGIPKAASIPQTNASDASNNFMQFIYEEMQQIKREIRSIKYENNLKAKLSATSTISSELLPLQSLVASLERKLIGNYEFDDIEESISAISEAKKRISEFILNGSQLGSHDVNNLYEIDRKLQHLKIALTNKRNSD